MSFAPPIAHFRRRMILEIPADVIDGSGAATRTYSPLAVIWAQITPLSGEDRFVASHQEEAISHIVRIRWRDDVTSQMRLVLDSRKFIVRSVYDADERRRFLTCRCEEIKP